MSRWIEIRGRRIGPGYPTYFVAEMSSNHCKDFDRAVEIMKAAKAAGADAIKLQTYTADTLTINCDREYFCVGGNSLWKGEVLHDLYDKACTPWDWQPELKVIAEDMGLDLFSTPFDETAVDFLEAMDVPAYKIASFEVVHLPMIERIAQTGKPTIMSTGIATLAEIDEAVRTFRKAGGTQLALLKCTSAYPASPDEMNLRTIPHLADAFDVPVGLSDHSLYSAVPVTAVALGACIVEKHFALSRSDPSADASFSLEPSELRSTIEAIRIAEQALGRVNYDVTEKEEAHRLLRRSIFVVRDVKAGETFTEDNIRVIRPGHGLHTRYYHEVLGRRASCNISMGTPLVWDLIAGSE